MTKAMVHDNALETNIWEEYHREFNKYKIIKNKWSLLYSKYDGIQEHKTFENIYL